MRCICIVHRYVYWCCCMFTPTTMPPSPHHHHNNISAGQVVTISCFWATQLRVHLAHLGLWPRSPFHFQIMPIFNSSLACRDLCSRPPPPVKLPSSVLPGPHVTWLTKNHWLFMLKLVTFVFVACISTSKFSYLIIELLGFGCSMSIELADRFLTTSYTNWKTSSSLTNWKKSWYKAAVSSSRDGHVC